MYRGFILAGVVGLWALSLLCPGCDKRTSGGERPGLGEQAWYRFMREKMVKNQIKIRGVRDERVLAALRKVPRHLFVPDDIQNRAYDDNALPIGQGQTISQPYIVGLMTELLELEPEHRVLEIGTGSGYQAAVLAELVEHVYTIEILEPLAKSAQERLGKLGHTNVTVRHGDGYWGWPEEAPFDAVIVTAAPDEVPPPLVEQLKLGGRLVIPVGRWEKDLVQLVKEEEGVRERRVIPVHFVPMTGEAQKH